MAASTSGPASTLPWAVKPSPWTSPRHWKHSAPV